MTIDFTAGELEVTLVPYGRTEARKTGGDVRHRFTVHPQFGYPKTRFVQGIADKVGGTILYLEAWTGGHVANVLPVPRTRGIRANGTGTSEGDLQYAAAFAATAAARNYDVVAVGSGRVRWQVTARSNQHSTRDANDVDQVGVGQPAACGGPFRKEF